MYAIAAGPVADPAAALSVRNPMSEMSFHANALASENTPAPISPYTNTRLWPHRSPALPNAGPTTPNASSGAVIVQLMMVTVLPRSSATVFSETTNSVMVKLTVNTLASNTPRVALRCVRPTRLVMRCFSNADHGMTEISSTPPESITPGSLCAEGGRCSSRCTAYTVLAQTLTRRCSDASLC